MAKKIINREQDTRRDDKIKDVNIGLLDIDKSIKYHLEKVIRPRVMLSNSELIDVPIIYGTPERWKSVRKDGFYRDKKNQIQKPLIMFRRTSFDNNRELARHLDANKPQVFVDFVPTYTKYNQYDRFSRLRNQIKQRQIHRTIIPKYVTLSYEGMIWTSLVVHMNKIQETINYAESSYWGEPDKFRFSAVINSFDTNIELGEGEDRVIKSSFSIELKGYIVSDALQKQLIQSSEVNYNATKIVVTEGDDKNNLDIGF